MNIAHRLPSIEALQESVATEDTLFSAWRNSVPDGHWTKKDLTALRIGYELGKALTLAPLSGEAVAEIVGFSLGLPDLEWIIRNPLAKGDKLYASPPATVPTDADMARALEWVRHCGCEGLEQHLPAIEEAIAAYTPPQVRTVKREATVPVEACVWTYDTDTLTDTAWDTQCGHRHQFTSDGPVENEHKFCQYCGGELAALIGK